MGLGNKLTEAWAWTAPSGGTSRRIMTLGLRALLKIEEDLTDIYYRRRGLQTASPIPDLYGTGAELSGYEGIPWRLLRVLFRSCPVGPDDVLIDYGSGKGRSVIWTASNYRLRRVMGVELDRELHDIAEANLARWSGGLLCDKVEFICADATELDVPDDVTIVYLFSPFTGSVFEKLLGRIQESLARNPRKLVILYGHPVMHASLIKAGFSVEQHRSYALNDWAIYRYGYEQARSREVA
jgi:Methyltransferase domain